jgi:hypothetical protein
VDPEVGLFDHRVGPNRCNRVALVDDVAGAVNHCQQDIERPAAQPDWAVTLQQEAA